MVEINRTAAFAFVLIALLSATSLAEAATIRALAQDTYRINHQTGDVACGATAADDITYTARLIEVDVGPATLGGSTGILPNSVSKILIDPVGVFSGNPVAQHYMDAAGQNLSASPSQYQPLVLWKMPGRECYNIIHFNYGSSPSVMVRFDAAGNSNTPGYIAMGTNSGSDAPYTQTYLGIFEYGQTFGATAIPLHISSNSIQFSQSGSSGTLYYNTGTGAGYQPHAVPPTFTTNRGISFTSASSNQISFSLPGTTQNQPPVITSTGGPSTLTIGQTGTWVITASDPENGALTYNVNWGDGSSGSPKQTASFTHSYPQAGTYTVSFTVTDSAGASAQSTISVAVSSTTPQNQPPHITGGMAPTSLTVGQSGSYSVSAYDPEGGPLTYTTTWGDGTSSGPQSSPSFTHSYSQVGTYNVLFRVFDSAGASDQVGAQTTVTGATQTPCVDYDNGQNIYVASYGKGNYAGSGSVGDEWIIGADGTTSAQPSPYGYSIVYDHCANSNLIEAYCTADGKLGSMGTDCPTGYVCSGGACVATSQQANLIIERVWMEADPNNAGSNTVYSKVTVNGQPASVNDVAVTYTTTDANGATYTSNVAGSCQNPAYCKYNYFGMNYGAGMPCGSLKVKVDAKYIGLAASSNRPEATKTETFTLSPPYCTQQQETSVFASLSVPQNTYVGESVLVSGKAAYTSGARNQGTKLFRIVTRFYDSNLIDYAQKPQEKTVQFAETGDKSRFSAVVSAASKQGIQERVDFVRLQPGESKEISAYFTAKMAGRSRVEMKVYEVTPTYKDCSNSPEKCSDSDYKLAATAVAGVTILEKPLPPSGSFTLELSQGWNMVSNPSSSKVSMETLSQACGTQSFAWKLAQSGYMKESYLEPGVGYWVKSSRDCKFEIGEASYSPSTTELFSGWNLIPAFGKEVAIADYLGSCDVASGPWYYSHSASGSAYQYSANLEPGKAYWLKVRSACKLGIDEVPPSPPSYK